MAYKKPDPKQFKNQDSTFTPMSRIEDPDYPGYLVIEDIMLRYSSPKSSDERYIRQYHGTHDKLIETYNAVRSEDLLEGTLKTWMTRYIQKRWIPTQRGNRYQPSVWEYDKRASKKTYDAFEYAPDPCMVKGATTTLKAPIKEAEALPDIETLSDAEKSQLMSMYLSTSADADFILE